MAEGTPCPNPNCIYVFPREAVAGKASITCPKCTGVYQVKVAGTEEPVPRRKQSVGWFNLMSIAVALLGIVGLLCLLAYAGYLQRTKTESTSTEPFKSASFNYRLLIPDDWKRDDATQNWLEANLVLVHEDPRVWFAVAVRDLKTQTLPVSELVDQGTSRLKSQFKTLAFEPAAECKIAGQSGQRVVFQGELDGALMSGDVTCLQHQGFAYWLITWCPSESVAQVEAAMAAMKNQFGLLQQRPNWQVPKKTFAGTKLPYSLTAEGQRWQPARFDASDFDPLADLALSAKEPGGADSPERQALFLVLILPVGEGTSPGDLAQAHLLERQKETYPETTIEKVAPEPAMAVVDKVGGEPGEVRTLKVTNTKSLQKFVMLGIVARPDGVIVLQAECPANRRTAWEEPFRALIGSFEMK